MTGLPESPPTNEAKSPERHRRASFEALEAWLAALPDWLRPALFGPLLLLHFAASRGAIIVLPILAIVVLGTSRDPLADYLYAAKVYLLLLVACAVGGLFYGILGRRIRTVPIIGPYLAGILALFPYVLCLFVVVGNERPRLLSWPDRAEWPIILALSVLFGSAFGAGAFRMKNISKREQQS